MLGTTYLLYIGISLAMTFWVGRTLNKNGHIFLLENYADNVPLAQAINSMLLVGFYMINIGFISYTLKITRGQPDTYAQVLEFLSVKVGFIAIVLGVMHFALMYALQRYSQGRKSTMNRVLAQNAQDNITKANSSADAWSKA